VHQPYYMLPYSFYLKSGGIYSKQRHIRRYLGLTAGLMRLSVLKVLYTRPDRVCGNHHL